MDNKYSSINGDPDITKTHDNLDSTELDSDKTGRVYDLNSLNNLPIGLVTVMGHSTRTASVYGNDLRNKNPYKMGSTYTFLFYNDQPLIVIGPQYLYVLLLFVVVNLVNVSLSYFIYSTFHLYIKVIGLILFSLQILVFIYNVVVNPGIPNRKFYISESVMQSIYTYLEYTNSETFDKYKICKICNIYVPPELTVIHCEDCNICVNSKFE